MGVICNAFSHNPQNNNVNNNNVNNEDEISDLEIVFTQIINNPNIVRCFASYGAGGGSNITITYNDNSIEELFIECTHWEFEDARGEFTHSIIHFMNPNDLLRLG